MSRPTLRDVAAKAGLSVTQVSRALNDHDDVAVSTKELARKVAAELRYIPNLEARRLKDPATRTWAIGLILPSDSLRFNDPFFGDLLTSMVSEAGACGLRLELSTHPQDTPATEPYDLAVRRNQVDGFVVLRTTAEDPRLAFLLEANVPFVAFGRPQGMMGFPAVVIAGDSFDPVVDHLLDLGHTRIACMAEPPQYASGAARLAGFRKAADERGLHLAEEAIVEAGFHERSGYEAAQRLLRETTRPTAIVAMNDLLALGALEAAADLGLDVPGQLSVIGFDDVRAARQVLPALTTVRQPADEVGRALVGLLCTAIEAGVVEHVDHFIETSLTIRQSSAPAAD